MPKYQSIEAETINFSTSIRPKHAVLSVCEGEGGGKL